ncbi:MAG: ATP-binding cassette domain-containing protein, partial [Ignavibacterium sp.]
MNKVVEIKNLSKSFDSLNVLRNVSLTVEEGENMVVFGQSGTGKSVLLKCIVRLMEPDSGEIFINNKDVLAMDLKQLNDLRKDFG